MPQIVATAHLPDGSPFRGPGSRPHDPTGEPFARMGRDEQRAIRSAKHAWIPSPKFPAFGPERGSTIRVDGVVVAEWRLIPILGPDGAVVDAREGWVDVRAEAAQAAREKLLAEARAQVGTK